MSDLNYDSRLKFGKYKNDKSYDNLSFASKFDYLKEFQDKLENLNKNKSIWETVKLRKLVFNKTSNKWKISVDYELRTIFLVKKKQQRNIQNFSDLFLDEYTYDDWFDKPNDRYLDNVATRK